MGRRHERRRLLVPRKHKRDARFAQRFDNVEIFLARYAEDEIDTLVLKRRDQQVGTFGHYTSLFQLKPLIEKEILNYSTDLI